MYLALELDFLLILHDRQQSMDQAIPGRIGVSKAILHCTAHTIWPVASCLCRAKGVRGQDRRCSDAGGL